MAARWAIWLCLATAASAALAQPPSPPDAVPAAASASSASMVPPIADPGPAGSAPIAFVTQPVQERGPFAAVDLSLLFPHVKHDLRGVVAQPAFGIAAIGFPAPIMFDEVRPPFAPLDVTGAPKLTLGWRLADGRGAVQTTYRLVASEGCAMSATFDPWGDSCIYSRLNINEVGLNYSTREQPLGALWSLRWEVGARLATIFHDTEAFGPVIGQQTSNYFIGAGPQAALDITREFPSTGLALFSRVDAADYLGRIQQRFRERLGDPVGGTFGYSERDGSQAVPYLGLQAGLSWLSEFGHCRLTMGYEFNQWWNTARLDDSRGWIQAQGLFFRTEFNY
jgi:hypothetical protein